MEWTKEKPCEEGWWFWKPEPDSPERKWSTMFLLIERGEWSAVVRDRIFPISPPESGLWSRIETK